LPGFAIAFDTRSETGETVSMSLKALFVAQMLRSKRWRGKQAMPPPPVAAQVTPDGEVIQGFTCGMKGTRSWGDLRPF